MRNVDDIIQREIFCLANELDQVLYDKDVNAYLEAWENRSHDTEIFQFFIVSDWLADKLSEIDEPVAKDFYGVSWWGRTCCGQAIEADGTIQKILENIS